MGTVPFGRTPMSREIIVARLIRANNAAPPQTKARIMT